MLHYLHNVTPLQVTAWLPANDDIFRVGKARCSIHPQDARAQLVLCGVVSEEALRFRRGITRLKTAPHHQKDIYVTRVRLRCDVAPEDDEPLHSTCTTRQRLDAFQTCGDCNALHCIMAEVCDDLGKRGLIDADGQKVHDLIRQMWQVNPTWGSPRIVGELRKLGIAVAKSTVEKYRPRPKKPPSPTWKTFLKDHVQDLVALDCFIVPTVTFRVLFVLVILAYERRRIVHFNITEYPPAEWTAQQAVEAFPRDAAPRYLFRDRDRIYGTHFRQRVRHMGIKEVLTAPQSPWQNPYVERLIGSIRRECLDHVIVLHARHVQRLLTGYFAYDHHWRTHLSLAMDCPNSRPIQPPACGQVIAVPEAWRLHHHYERVAA
jgi:transposase InsO family protein